jgi:hypothetical protein
MFAKAIMAAQAGRIDGWWIGSSTEYDSQRENARDGSGLNHVSRTAHRSSMHSSALDNAFRFIDGMTNSKSDHNPWGWEVKGGIPQLLSSFAFRSTPSTPGR